MTDAEIIGNLELHNGYGLIDQTLKLINRQKAEIERLETMHSEMCIGMKVLKKKAIKEFAERLKEKKINIEIMRLPLLDRDIDNLVKEMVGDK